jgi:Tat protein secretion system quality control protein TatD with DNase activity
MTPINHTEYKNYLINADQIFDDRLIFHSFAGPHTFETKIIKEGIIYFLGMNIGFDFDNPKEITYYIRNKDVGE